jgi:hypothetical protein
MVKSSKTTFPTPMVVVVMTGPPILYNSQQCSIEVGMAWKWNLEELFLNDLLVAYNTRFFNHLMLMTPLQYGNSKTP